MRQMLERISPVLLVSVLAGGFVIMSALPATAEIPNDRVGPPHGERPTAANNAAVAPEYLAIDSIDQMLTADDLTYIAAQLAADEAAAAAAADAAAHDAAHAAADAAADAAAAAGGYRGSSAQSANYGSCFGDVDCFLACTRAHESDTSGGYSAVSSGGSYRGAYQFQQSTWDAAVAGAGFDQYAGVPADETPAEVQDAAATHLYSVSGTNPWGGRC